MVATLLATVKDKYRNCKDSNRECYFDCDKRCSFLLEKLSTNTTDSIQHLLQQFTHIVLDFTFIDENILVNQDFPESISASVIQSVFNDLENILTVAKTILPDQQPIDSLGEELLECIYWRKGALYYMYCKTIENDKDRINKDIQQYEKYLVNGIENLKMMLETRKPVVKDRSDAVTEDEDTFDLIKSGIYSDTHVLALIYGSEICYWLDKCDKENLFQTNHLNYKQIGECYLKLYIHVVNGPLKNQGWSVENAESMLKSIKES
ncbi:hypothetical protein SNE40_011245 [Patella caerulea]